MKTTNEIKQKSNSIPLHVTHAMAEAYCLGARPNDAHGHHYAAMAHMMAADKIRMFMFSLKPGTVAMKNATKFYVEHLEQCKRHSNNIIAGIA
jgi:hypothetical protein